LSYLYDSAIRGIIPNFYDYRNVDRFYRLLVIVSIFSNISLIYLGERLLIQRVDGERALFLVAKNNVGQTQDINKALSDVLIQHRLKLYTKANGVLHKS
jgi:hypothetical protein